MKQRERKKRKRCMSVYLIAQPCPIPCDPVESARLLCPWDSPRQEYWSVLPSPPLVDLPNPGIKPGSPALPAFAGGFLYHRATWEAPNWFNADLVLNIHLYLIGLQVASFWKKKIFKWLPKYLLLRFKPLFFSIILLNPIPNHQIVSWHSMTSLV